MAEHAALARRAGVGQVVLCRDGELIRLAPGAPGKIDEVPAGRLYKDGSFWSAPRSAPLPIAAGSAFPGLFRFRSPSANGASWSPIPR